MGEQLNRFFDLLWDVLVAQFGPLGPVYALAAFGVILILVSLPFLLTKSRDPNQRLEAARKDRYQSAISSLRIDANDNRLDSLAPYLEPQDQEEASEARLNLMRAGYRSRSAVRVYVLIRAIMGISFAFFGLAVVHSLFPAASETDVALAVAGGGGIGYLLPAFYVRNRRKEREEEITNSFPDALDLLLVCVEAGHSLDQAVDRVAREIHTAAPFLSDELALISAEVRAGRERTAVLRDFSERCGVSDISAFVTVLIQSAAFGTSIADALRTYSSEMRDKRLVRAEEKANVLPTKLTLGTMAFTVPPLVLILVGPSLIEVMRALSGFGG
jgi:tight adherence protein C